MTHAATKFSVIQVGLCAFVQASDADAKDRFVGHAYTFFLFPEYGPDITLSASACSFLRKNGMDFGAWMGWVFRLLACLACHPNDAMSMPAEREFHSWTESKLRSFARGTRSRRRRSRGRRPAARPRSRP